MSTAAGTGNAAQTMSGTSMAAPHVAGVAALMRQVHPHWNVSAIKSAIVNTGDPAQVTGYRTSRGGTGLVQPGASTVAQVVAHSEGGRFWPSLNFGFEEISRDFRESKTVVLKNHGWTPATFNVSQVRPSGAPHTLDIHHTSVTVPPSAAGRWK